MSALPWIAAGLAVGGGGLLLVAYARQKAAAQGQGGSLCESFLAPLAAAAGYPIPPEACKFSAVDKVLGAVAGAVGDAFKSEAERDADNRARNGAVELELREDVKKLAIGGDTVNGQPRIGTRLRGSVLRFQSGCVPFKGAPGWAKCAAGTHDMAPAGRYWNVDPANPPKIDPLKPWASIEAAARARAYLSDLGAGGTHDPTTARGADGRLAKVGGAYLVAGQAVMCDREPVLVRDHRTGGTVGLCQSAAPPPATVGEGERTKVIGGSVYRWNGSYWERVDA